MVTPLQRAQSRKEGGNSNLTVEKPDRHDLSQVISEERVWPMFPSFAVELQGGSLLRHTDLQSEFLSGPCVSLGQSLNLIEPHL